jgi:cation:H+ antiporter
MITTDLLFFSLACVFLAFSGHFVVKSLIKIARYYGLREFVVGFILVAITTSIPELFVGIISALSNISALSFGDIIGANIVDLTVVVGATALLGKRIKIENEIEKKDVFYTFFIALLPILLFLDHNLSRIDGIILLVAFLLYIFRLIIQRKHFRKIVSDHVSKSLLRKELILFVISVIVLLLSARFIVQFAVSLASELSLHPILIGLVIVSIGTTLPELLFETNSVLKGFSGMAVGDLLGSVVANSSLVLGVVSIIQPIEAYFVSFAIGAGFLIVSLSAFIVFARTEHEITWKEGLILLIFYILFVITSLIFRSYA